MNKKPIILMILLIVFSSFAFAGSYDWVRSPTSILSQNNYWTGINIFENIIYMNTTYINYTITDSLNVNGNITSNYTFTNGTYITDIMKWYYNSTGDEWIFGYVDDLI